MKKSKKGLVKVLLCVCLIISMAAGLSPLYEGSVAEAASKPKLSKTSVSIVNSKKYTLKLKNVKSGKKVKWSTSNKSVAAIKPNGSKVAITGKKVGSATVTAKYNGKKYTCKVKITPLLSASKKTLSIGKSGSVNITFKGSSSVSYKVADPSILSCSWGDWNGYKLPLNFTGKKSGTTRVTVSNTTNNEKVVIKVTVDLDVHISLPQLPTSTWYSFRNAMCDINITDIKVESSETYAKITFVGNVTPTIDTITWVDSYNYPFTVKLMRDGVVVATNRVYTPKIYLNENFSCSTIFLDLDNSGEYTLSIGTAN